MKITVLATIALIASLNIGLAKTNECAAIRAHNDAAPSIGAMEELPCRCIPMSGRISKVYATPPPGLTCSNHLFYDKACHKGFMCSNKVSK